MLIFDSLYHLDALQDVGAARALNQEAAQLAEEIGSTLHRLILWCNAGIFSLLLGEFDQATQQGQRALRLTRRNGSPIGFIYWNIFTLACSATQQGHFVLGAHLTGAHDSIEERAIEPLGGMWPEIEIRARERNRDLLREALGAEEYERLIAIGKSLSADRLYDLALGRVSLDL